MPRLFELASTIRSKNAGVDHVTFDIIFSNREAYERARSSGAITREAVARLYRVSLQDVTHFTHVEAAPAIKFTLRRPRPSGDPGETDVFGSQQYPPLFEIEIP